jgi:C4-dicarboxylate transporter DctQ subunit
MILFCNVILRGVFNAGFAWAEEAVRYLLAVVTFMGLSLGVTEKADINVDAFLRLFKGQGKRYLKILINTIELLALISLGLLSYQFAQEISALDQITPALRIPMHYLYLLIFIGVIPRLLFGATKYYDILKEN